MHSSCVSPLACHCWISTLCETRMKSLSRSPARVKQTLNPIHKECTQKEANKNNGGRNLRMVGTVSLLTCFKRWGGGLEKLKRHPPLGVLYISWSRPAKTIYISRFWFIGQPCTRINRTYSVRPQKRHLIPVRKPVFWTSKPVSSYK